MNDTSLFLLLVTIAFDRIHQLYFAFQGSPSIVDFILISRTLGGNPDIVPEASSQLLSSHACHCRQELKPDDCLVVLELPGILYVLMDLLPFCFPVSPARAQYGG